MQLAAALTLANSAPPLRDVPDALVLTGRERDPALAGLGKLSVKQRTYLGLIAPEFQLA
jgi:hypothetical protein